MVAVSWVALTNVVARALPFHCTIELPTKLLPFTVSVNAPEPALTEVGDNEVIAGTGLFVAVTLKFIEFDAPPPGLGLLTKTAGVLAVATSPARIVAVNCVELTNEVALFAPPKLTSAPLTKPVPFTVKVNPPEPATTPVGDNEVRAGTGFVAAVMVKVTEFDWPPPGVGFVTVTEGVPEVARSPARIAAVNCVALTKVVVLGAPLKITDEVETKFVPFTISVNPPEPAAAFAGEILEMLGTGFVVALTLKLTELEAPPPGVGLVTTTAGVPTVRTSAARIDTVTCVALTNDVVLLTPPKLTVAPFTKPDPFTVNVKLAEPATTPVGDRDVIAGVGLLTAPAPA